ncbi:hypothetical protein FVE85_5731 [Porphyridium purpureum]|uniref:Uncharacterized protein n=1 Tax=Porphyridium purpureum TaxID=35688 RepID=A0A5J4Z3G1_PORPP|nr:hypothetical protein FVE85_5731 [Porphyridium purpureum]|eukprot:POR6640..scf295_1
MSTPAPQCSFVAPHVACASGRDRGHNCVCVRAQRTAHQAGHQRTPIWSEESCGGASRKRHNCSFSTCARGANAGRGHACRVTLCAQSGADQNDEGDVAPGRDGSESGKKQWFKDGFTDSAFYYQGQRPTPPPYSKRPSEENKEFVIRDINELPKREAFEGFRFPVEDEEDRRLNFMRERGSERAELAEELEFGEWRARLSPEFQPGVNSVNANPAFLEPDWSKKATDSLPEIFDGNDDEDIPDGFDHVRRAAEVEKELELNKIRDPVTGRAWRAPNPDLYDSIGAAFDSDEFDENSSFARALREQVLAEADADDEELAKILVEHNLEPVRRDSPENIEKELESAMSGWAEQQARDEALEPLAGVVPAHMDLPDREDVEEWRAAEQKRGGVVVEGRSFDLPPFNYQLEDLQSRRSDARQNPAEHGESRRSHPYPNPIEQGREWLEGEWRGSSLTWTLHTEDEMCACSRTGAIETSVTESVRFLEPEDFSEVVVQTKGGTLVKMDREAREFGTLWMESDKQRKFRISMNPFLDGMLVFEGGKWTNGFTQLKTLSLATDKAKLSEPLRIAAFGFVLERGVRLDIELLGELDHLDQGKKRHAAVRPTRITIVSLRQDANQSEEPIITNHLLSVPQVTDAEHVLRAVLGKWRGSAVCIYPFQHAAPCEKLPSESCLIENDAVRLDEVTWRKEGAEPNERNELMSPPRGSQPPLTATGRSAESDRKRTKAVRAAMRRDKERIAQCSILKTWALGASTVASVRAGEQHPLYYEGIAGVVMQDQARGNPENADCCIKFTHLEREVPDVVQYFFPVHGGKHVVSVCVPRVIARDVCRFDLEAAVYAADLRFALVRHYSQAGQLVGCSSVSEEKSE